MSGRGCRYQIVVVQQRVGFLGSPLGKPLKINHLACKNRSLRLNMGMAGCFADASPTEKNYA